MEYTVPIKIERLEDGRGYSATSESFPGFLACGQTFEETVRNADSVLKSLLETYREKGVEPPIKAERMKRISIDIPLPFEFTKEAIAAC
jgi:predicted RNase H-like HicB family nuclease